MLVESLELSVPETCLSKNTQRMYLLNSCFSAWYFSGIICKSLMKKVCNLFAKLKFRLILALFRNKKEVSKI